MSTLSSWIDPDEISELMPLLLRETRKKDAVSSSDDDSAAGGGEDAEPDAEEAQASVEAPPSQEAPADLEGSDPPSSDPGESIASDLDPDPDSVLEPEVSAATEEPSEPAADSDSDSDSPEIDASPEIEASPEGGAAPEIDFDSPEAYDAAAFPTSEDEAGESTGPARQAAAVQAAVTLERARDRANEGGLLKSTLIEEPGSADLEIPAPESGDDLETPAAPIQESTGEFNDATEEAGPDSPPAGEPETEAEADPATVEADATPAPEVQELPAFEPGTFRHRLAEFALRTIEMTGGSEPSVTDFQSYPLYPAANGDDNGKAGVVGSILRMTDLIGQLPDQPNGGSEKTTQVALTDSQWLCVLTQGSASGGVCATLKTPNPIDENVAGKLHAGLRSALTGTAG